LHGGYFIDAITIGAHTRKFSKHIEHDCSRCGCLEEEFHLLFLGPFSKAA
jgi:hypothetical protein